MLLFDGKKNLASPPTRVNQLTVWRRNERSRSDSTVPTGPRSKPVKLVRKARCQWQRPLSRYRQAGKCFKIESSHSSGRVAQLGEHLLCKQGVAGSNPVASTNLIPALTRVCKTFGQSKQLKWCSRPRENSEPLSTQGDSPSPRYDFAAGFNASAFRILPPS